MDDKLAKLKSILTDMGSLIVAYSGGVDSTFLVAVAYDVLADRALAVTGVSPSLPPSELRQAADLARLIGIRHQIIDTHEFDKPQYIANNPDRCYHCKDELYTRLTFFAREHDMAYIVDGCNLDDASDHRPGRRAAKQHGVRSPLIEAGLSKAEIRELSRQRGLPTWDKPAMACLASRIPYGTPITIDFLEHIDEAESFLRSLGVRQIRVRHHDAVARIETDDAGLEIVMANRETVVEKLKALGYLYVTLDLAGYRPGSLNQALARRA